MARYAATIKTVRSAGRKFYRIAIAHINKARFDVYSRTYEQSFAPKYLISESGDYTKPEDCNILALQKELQFKGIKLSELEWH